MEDITSQSKHKDKGELSFEIFLKEVCAILWHRCGRIPADHYVKPWYNREYTIAETVSKLLETYNCW